ncbi:hypothetical protein [Leptospira wolbachii]|uniref:hypothetical protein n=1 Tax=Leptospira wolbachii TaxID=29511 RepID=UPI0002E0FE47|nr:hypothetical protein [Leptospira wolbachii]
MTETKSRKIRIEAILPLVFSKTRDTADIHSEPHWDPKKTSDSFVPKYISERLIRIDLLYCSLR